MNLKNYIQSIENNIWSSENKVHLSINLTKSDLITETFTVFILVIEGQNDFDIDFLEKIFNRNYQLFQKYYSKDADLKFIFGWSISLCFYFFKEKYSEEEGNKLILEAFQLQKTNLLFKWANRGVIPIENDKKESFILDLKKSLTKNSTLPEFINSYFLDII